MQTSPTAVGLPLFGRCSVVVQCLTEQRLNNERTTNEHETVRTNMNH